MSHQRPRQPGVRAVRPRSIGGSRLTFRLAAVALLSASVLGLGGPGTALAATGSHAAAVAPVVEQAAAPTPKGLTGEVYGFLPYWEIDSSVDAYLRYDLLTTIALFAVYYDAAGNLNTATLLGSGRAALISTVVQHAHAQGVRVDLTLRPSNDTANANQTFFGNAPAQAAAIANMAAQVTSLGLDGANIDVESLYGTDFPAYGAFGAALRAALVKTSPSARVTVSTNANVSGSGMAAQAISHGVDRAFLMGYNYRGAGTSPVGSISPLVSSVGGLSLSWSIGQYDKLHVPRNRIILGLPYYGMTWPTTSGTLHATRSGSGVAFFPTDSLPPPAGTVIHYDAVESAAWYAVQDPTTKAWSETYFDDETSLRAKYGLAVSDGLAGVGMWALGYDAGQPGYWEAIASTFGVLRLAGADRYGTAVAVSSNLLQPGAGTVIVANGQGFADALGGTAAAGHLGGSLLLTMPTSLPASVAIELARVGPAKVIVLGGKAAVSDAVLGAIQAQAAGRRGDARRRGRPVRHRGRPLPGRLPGRGDHRLHRLRGHLSRRPGGRCGGGPAGCAAAAERPIRALGGDAGGTEAPGSHDRVPPRRHRLPVEGRGHRGRRGRPGCDGEASRGSRPVCHFGGHLGPPGSGRAGRLRGRRHELPRRPQRGGRGRRARRTAAADDARRSPGQRGRRAGPPQAAAGRGPGWHGRGQQHGRRAAAGVPRSPLRAPAIVAGDDRSAYRHRWRAGDRGHERVALTLMAGASPSRSAATSPRRGARWARPGACRHPSHGSTATSWPTRARSPSARSAKPSG